MHPKRERRGAMSDFIVIEFKDMTRKATQSSSTDLIAFLTVQPNIRSKRNFAMWSCGCVVMWIERYVSAVASYIRPYILLHLETL